MKIKKIFPDWLIGMIVSLFFLFITLTGTLDFTDVIEMKAFDFRVKIAAPEGRNPDIELVVISEEDLTELGHFPWPRDILSQGIHHLSLAGARVIALNVLFPEPEESTGLKTIKNLKQSFESLSLAQEGPGLSFYEKISEAVDDLDNDAKLYRAMKEAGNVVLPVSFDTLSSGRDMKIPEFLPRHAFKNIKSSNKEWSAFNLVWLSRVKPLLPALAEVAAAIGHLNLFPDSDGAIRDQIHVVGYLKDIYFPSFPIAIVKAFHGLKDEDMTVILGEGVHLRLSPSSTVKIPVTDPQMRTLINWNQGPGVAFHQTPFSKVYKNEIQTSLFRDKIVIIGPTAPGIGDRFVTPISGHLPGVEIVANCVANILKPDFLYRPPWISFIELEILILFGLFLTLALPRLKAGTGAIATLGLFIAYGVAGTAVLFLHEIWLKITPPMLLLVVGYILVTSKKSLITEKTKKKVETDSVETNKMLGLSFQQQGRLDLALQEFCKIPVEEEGVKELLYNLGLDFERKRQSAKALSTYKLILQDDLNFKDLDERISRLKGAEATLVFNALGGAQPGDIRAKLAAMDTKPTLGRYEVTGQLGRGAMGVVYKGEDPKIHRTVAIKTIMLSEFAEDMVEEIKERFFREAKSAGLLAHPNILAIYDCGEEQDLAYIAMEYLEGEDLEEYTQKENLLPLPNALAIVAQVAEALDYAHAKGIVHRDVKPANIVQLKETGDIKVTDFGITRIRANSKTKMGVILGTPAYMSPEQIGAKKVDGRSDIFSLGIVLFEMLTGEKPFKGEDMTSLMYQILREQHASPRSINLKIPSVVEKIVNKALEKDLEKRYQRAGHMAGHLRKVITKIDETTAKRRSRPKQ